MQYSSEKYIRFLIREVISHPEREDAVNRAWHSNVGDVIDESDIYQYVQSLHRNEEDFWDGDLGERIENFSKYKLMEVPVEEIEMDGYELDPEYKEEYKQKYKSSGSYPPIVLGYFSSGTYDIIDGNHRANALKSAGVKTIKSWVALARTN